MATTDKKSAVGAKLAKAPLVHVLTQVRFSPVLGMESFIPGLQEQLNKIGFPRAHKSQAQNIVLSATSAPQIDVIKKWDFVSKDKRDGVAITQDYVVLQTSRYDTFAQFEALLRKVLEAFISKVKVELLVERLGIRYIDLVRLRDGENFSNYLRPGLIGFPFSEIGNIEIKRAFSNTQSVAEMVDGSMLVVRCVQVDTGQFLPPDLLPPVLDYPIALTTKELVAILDFDHFVQSEMEFNVGLVTERLSALHKGANQAFLQSVEPHAFEVWKGNT